MVEREKKERKKVRNESNLILEPSKCFCWIHNFRNLNSSLRDNMLVSVPWLYLKSSENLHTPTSIVLAKNALCKSAFATIDTLF